MRCSIWTTSSVDSLNSYMSKLTYHKEVYPVKFYSVIGLNVF